MEELAAKQERNSMEPQEPITENPKPPKIPGRTGYEKQSPMQRVDMGDIETEIDPKRAKGKEIGPEKQEGG